MIETIKDDVIAKAFECSHRQYLVGDLKQAQELQHLHDSNVEVGITEYKTFGWEKPHYHPCTLGNEVAPNPAEQAGRAAA